MFTQPIVSGVYYGNVEVVHELYIAISEDKDKLQIYAVCGIINVARYFIFYSQIHFILYGVQPEFILHYSSV